MSYVLGLTGQTGAGKTTVCDALRARGVPVIDCDLLAREVIDNSKSCLGDLVLEFGCDVIDHNGELNRRKLGSVVFSDKRRLRRLNETTYPHIMRQIEETVGSYREAAVPLLVLDAPTLYEAGADKLCDAVIAVLAPEEARLRRIMARDALPEPDARNRIKSQHSDGFYKKRADFVVENSGTQAELLGYVDEILAQVCPAQDGIHETANV